jgi:hypothetical protein
VGELQELEGVGMRDVPDSVIYMGMAVVAFFVLEMLVFLYKWLW